jgi:hypothetical protein
MLLGGFLLVTGGCTDWDKEFARQCRAAAVVEISDQQLWRDYLVELRQTPTFRSKPTSADRFEVNDLTLTQRFAFTNSWVLQGRPNMGRREIYRNDHFVIDRRTGQAIARIGNLGLSTPSFGYTKAWSCIYDYPYLYSRQFARHV